MSMGKDYARIDITMDIYEEESITGQTRQRRSKGKRPTRRVIENRDVPLPQKWDDFMCLFGNKQDLARFLSQEILLHPSNLYGKIVVVGDPKEARSSSDSLDITSLQEWHEEALHCNANSIVIRASDTDVLLLLVAHWRKFRMCDNLWMLSGTGYRKIYISIKDIYNGLPVGSTESLLQFQSLTGCDTTSHFFVRSKEA
jgi:hypothetical protein